MKIHWEILIPMRHWDGVVVARKVSIPSISDHFWKVFCTPCLKHQFSSLS